MVNRVPVSIEAIEDEARKTRQIILHIKGDHHSHEIDLETLGGKYILNGEDKGRDKALRLIGDHWIRDALRKAFKQTAQPLPLNQLIRFKNEEDIDLTASIEPVKLCEKNGKYLIETSHYVGTYVLANDEGKRVNLGEDGYTTTLVFEIEPRFGNSVLYHMLEKSFRHICNVDEKLAEAHQNPSGSLLLLALLWLFECKRCSKNGLPRLYVPQKKDLNTLRGKLDTAQLIRNQITGKSLDLLPCHYRELTFQNIINVTIRRGIRIVRNLLKGRVPNSLAVVARMDQQLASYGVLPKRVDPRQLDHIHYTSMAEAYRPLMKLSKALFQAAPECQGGDRKNGLGFLFDITELWEFYLMEVLRENLPGNYRVATGNIKQDNEKKPLLTRIHEDPTKVKSIFNKKPDIIIKDGAGKNVAILDAKYRYTRVEADYRFDRVHQPYGIQVEDVDQLIVYMNRWQTEKGALVYPKENGEDSSWGGKAHWQVGDSNELIRTTCMGLANDQKDQFDNEKSFVKDVVDNLLEESPPLKLK